MPFHYIPPAVPNFDQSDDPGLIFMPMDSQFLLLTSNWRIGSAEKDALKHGIIASREVPTPAMYKEHQMRSGIIQEDAIGGLYVPTFIK